MSKFKTIGISGVVMLLLAGMIFWGTGSSEKYLKANVLQEDSISQVKKTSFLEMLNRIRSQKKQNHSSSEKNIIGTDKVKRSQKFLDLKKLIQAAKGERKKSQKSKVYNKRKTSKNLSLLRKRLFTKKNTKENFKTSAIRSRLLSLIKSKNNKGRSVKNIKEKYKSNGRSLFAKKLGFKLFGKNKNSNTYTSRSSSSNPNLPLRKEDCKLDGKTVKHGQLENFYSRRTAEKCSNHIHGRTCYNGTLSGYSQYKYSSCKKTSTGGGGTTLIKAPVEFRKLGNNASINVGESFVEIGKFRLENKSTTNKDIKIRSITFKNSSTFNLENTLGNVELYASNQKISTSTEVSTNSITFRLNNLVLDDSKIFYIRGDIISANKGNIIKFKIENISGSEVGTNHSLKIIDINNRNISSTNSELAAYTLEPGDINISRDPNSMLDQTYAPGTDDVVFLTARIIPSQPVLVSGINVFINSTNNNGIETLNSSFTNLKLYVNDRFIDSVNEFSIFSPQDLVDFITKKDTSINSGHYLGFNKGFEISGTSIIKVTGDIKSTATVGHDIKLALSKNGLITPKYKSTEELITSSDILGTAIASKVTINESKLTITRSDNLPDRQNLIAGIDDVTAMKFILSDNNDTGDVRVTAINIKQTITGGGNNEAPENYRIAIFVDGVQQGNSKTVGNDGMANINTLSVVIPSGQQKEFELIVDTLAASAGSQTKFMITSVDAENIETEDIISVEEGGIILGSGNTDTSGGGNCEGGTNHNYLCGALFNMKGSGILTVSNGPAILNDSNILIANSVDNEIYKLIFEAKNDEIEVTDLYFKAEGSDRVIFKLYNQSGTLLGTETTSGTDVHFNLTNYSNRIRVPKDSKTIVTIKVDVKDISQYTQTGKIINIELDDTKGVNGIEAITSATGTNLSESTITASVSEDYIAYKTKIEIRNSATQPTYMPGGSNTPIYRFEVTNDGAGVAVLNQIKVNILASSDVKFGNGVNNLRLARYSSSGYFGAPHIITTDSITASVFKDFTEEVNGTNYYEVQLIGGFTDNQNLSNSYIMGSILSDNQYSVNKDINSVTGNIIWSDKSNGGQEGPHMNGYQIITPSTSSGIRE